MIKFLLLISLTLITFSQSKWKRSEPVQTSFTLFKSSQVLNLHSAEGIPKGDLQYGISHRFNGPLSTGWSDFYGLDGGAVMRLKLAYGITDDLYVALGRSNEQQQLDLTTKYKFYQSKKLLPIPIMMALMANVSYAQEDQVFLGTIDSQLETADKIQYQISLIINTMLFDRLAIGVNPTYLNDALIRFDEDKYAFTLGYYLQYYLGDDMTSFIVEANPTIAGFRGTGISALYDTYSLGMEFETGGHFFKFMVSNNNLINQTQLNQGSDLPFSLDNLRFGFQITRNFGL